MPIVAAAKRRVFGQCRDRHDRGARPRSSMLGRQLRPVPDYVAADLLAQAEHDAVAQSILDDRRSGSRGCASRPSCRAATRRPCRAAMIASASWRDYGAIILVSSGSSEADPADRQASRPNIWRSMAEDEDELAAPHPQRRVRSSSATYTPEAIGDYVGGSNHVLPTARSARFASGLGVLDFMKRTTSILKCAPASASATLGPARHRARAKPKASMPMRDPMALQDGGDSRMRPWRSGGHRATRSPSRLDETIDRSRQPRPGARARASPSTTSSRRTAFRVPRP